jgi:hypothetical protein
VVEGWAAWFAARGEPARAAELLGLAHTLHGFRDTASFEVTRTTATVTAAIGPDEFAAAYQRGRALTRADGLALADQPGPEPVRPSGRTSGPRSGT